MRTPRLLLLPLAAAIALAACAQQDNAPAGTTETPAAAPAVDATAPLATSAR